MRANMKLTFENVNQLVRELIYLELAVRQKTRKPRIDVNWEGTVFEASKTFVDELDAYIATQVAA